MPPFSPAPPSPRPDEGSVGAWQRTRREAINERARNQPLTEPDSQPGQATTGGPTNLNITRRQLSDTGANRLASARGLGDSASTFQQVRREQRADTQALSVTKALRQARQIGRTERDNKRGGKTGAVGAAVGTAAGQTITAELLKQAWLNLIDSFGLTLLYINFHFVARYFAGSQMFCRFGLEWFSAGKKSGAQNTASAPTAGAKGGKSASAYAIDIATKPLELLELIGLGLCDLVVLVAAAVLAAFIFFIAGGWLLVVADTVGL